MEIRESRPPCAVPESGLSARRRTSSVKVGGVWVGSGHPVVVQSMTNTDTADVDATVRQVAELAEAGSELVRVTVNTSAAAAAVPGIVSRLDGMGVQVPLIGDFHFNGHILLPGHPECAAALSKYRINPGNVGTKKWDAHFATIVECAIENGKPVRIGVNWGSLDAALLTRMMDENAALPEPLPADTVMIAAVVESAMGSGAGRRGDRASARRDHSERQGLDCARFAARVPGPGTPVRLPPSPGPHRGRDGP